MEAEENTPVKPMAPPERILPPDTPCLNTDQGIQNRERRPSLIRAQTITTRLCPRKRATYDPRSTQGRPNRKPTKFGATQYSVQANCFKPFNVAAYGAPPAIPSEQFSRDARCSGRISAKRAK